MVVNGTKLKPGLKFEIDKYSPTIDFNQFDISSNMTIYITDDGRLSCNSVNAVMSFVGNVILVESLYPHNAYYSIYVKSIGGK